MPSIQVPPRERLVLLGKLLSADFNSIADQAIALTQPGSGAYLIQSIVATNASTSLTTAKGTFYAGAGKTNNITAGTTTSVFTGLVAATDTSALGIVPSASAMSAAEHFSRYTANTTIYLSLTTAQGGAATADIYVFGYDLT